MNPEQQELEPDPHFELDPYNEGWFDGWLSACSSFNGVIQPTPSPQAIGSQHWQPQFQTHGLTNLQSSPTFTRIDDSGPVTPSGASSSARTSVAIVGNNNPLSLPWASPAGTSSPFNPSTRTSISLEGPTLAGTPLEIDTDAATKNELVAAALQFWSATRMIERFWLICDVGQQNILGVPPMRENIGPCRRNPRVDAIPVTPAMDTQLDEIVIRHVLTPLSKAILRKLKAQVLAKKKENWHAIYLVSFILLHNVEQVLAHIIDFSRRFSLNPGPRSNHGSPVSYAYLQASKTILSYFQFTGGASPLSLDFSSQTDGFSQDQIKHLQEIKEEIARQDKVLHGLTGLTMYETELYWCHQLLFPDWKADTPHAGRLLEFTEKDFLVT